MADWELKMPNILYGILSKVATSCEPVEIFPFKGVFIVCVHVSVHNETRRTSVVPVTGVISCAPPSVLGIEPWLLLEE